MFLMLKSVLKVSPNQILIMESLVNGPTIQIHFAYRVVHSRFRPHFT